MPRVIRTSQAFEDVLDIWTYIARDNVSAADRLIREIDEALSALAKDPEIGIPQFQYRKGLRCKPVHRRYLIFYEPIDDGIRVFRVLHGARDWPSLL